MRVLSWFDPASTYSKLCVALWVMRPAASVDAVMVSTNCRNRRLSEALEGGGARLRRGSHRPEDMRELGLELATQILADIDHHRERAGKLLVVGNAGVDQDAIVEITRQE